jgi:hypothetical protein
MLETHDRIEIPGGGIGIKKSSIYVMMNPIENRFIMQAGIIGLLGLLCMGCITRGVQIYPGSPLPREELAFFILKSPSLKTADQCPPLEFTVHVEGKSFSMGSRKVLELKSGPISIGLQADPLEKVKLDVDKEGLYDFWQSPSRWKASVKQQLTYSGRRILYPDRMLELEFVAEPGKKYRFRFLSLVESEKDERVYLELYIQEKKTKKRVSNIAKIIFN